MRIAKLAAIALLVNVMACAEKPAEIDGETADWVFLNGVVYTADPQQRVLSAVAVRGERIVYVGDDAGAAVLAGDATRVTDLQGQMLLPGLHDMHIHPMGIIESGRCDLASAELNLAQIRDAIAACIEQRKPPPGDWLPVDQWNFSNGNQPAGELRSLRQALDAAAPDHPVILWGNDGHHGAVNSAALALGVNEQGVRVGINRATLASDFADYRETIGVDAAGEPNGELHETARFLVQPPAHNVLGNLDPTRMPQVAAKLAENGITSIQDAAAPPESLPLYKSLVDSGAMTFRLAAALFQDVDRFTDAAGAVDIRAMLAELEKIRFAYRDNPYIRTDAAKIFVDGVIEGNPLNDPPTLPNAAVLSNYQQPRFAIDAVAGKAEIVDYIDTDSELCQRVRDELDAYQAAAAVAEFRDEHGFHPVQCRQSRGVLEHSESFIHDYMRALDAAGFRIHAHVIGDRAARAAVEGFELLRAGNGDSGLHHSLGHVQLVAPEDYGRIGELGLYLVFTYAWIVPDLLYDLTVIPFIDRLDGAAALYQPTGYYMQNNYPAAQLRAAGAILAAGSDAPVDTREPRPFVNIQQAVTRADDQGQVMNPAGSLDIKTALDAYTINGARLFGHAGETGSIEVGKLADLVVIDRDLLTLAAEGRAGEIASARVVLTLFEGRPVYEAR